MTIAKKTTVQGEIEKIFGRRKTIRAEDVVEYAKKNPKSAIRDEFDKRDLFNDEVAADIARTAFARYLIQRVRVRFVDSGKAPSLMRVYVNLTDERLHEGGGYRHRSDVYKDHSKREMLLSDLSRDVETIVKRYADLLSNESIRRLREVAASPTNKSLL